MIRLWLLRVILGAAFGCTGNADGLYLDPWRVPLELLRYSLDLFKDSSIFNALPVHLLRQVFFSVFLVLFSKLFFIIFLKLFLSRLGPFLDPMLGLCWELFGAFFALKLRSYLKVVFSSIFDRI